MKSTAVVAITTTLSQPNEELRHRQSRERKDHHIHSMKRAQRDAEGCRRRKQEKYANVAADHIRCFVVAICRCPPNRSSPIWSLQEGSVLFVAQCMVRMATKIFCVAVATGKLATTHRLACINFDC
eukprot:scaffold2046_cov171-Amphora_coffeaeformis.AAC.3